MCLASISFSQKLMFAAHKLNVHGVLSGLCCRCALILISFEAAQSLAAFVPPFAAGQFSVFAIQVSHRQHCMLAQFLRCDGLSCICL